MHQIVDNVKELLAEKGSIIKTNKHLLLHYWLKFDEMRVDSRYMSTQDFIHKCTSPTDILNAKLFLDSIREVG
jgi:hypothetical protein